MGPGLTSLPQVGRLFFFAVFSATIIFVARRLMERLQCVNQRHKYKFSTD